MSTMRTVIRKDTEKSAPTSVTPEREPSEPQANTLHIKTDDETFAAMSLAELERTASLARVRILYASAMRSYWDSELYWRTIEFDRTVIAYEQRKHGFTDEMIAAPSKRGAAYQGDED